MQIDAQRIIDRLTARIAELELRHAVDQETISQLTAHVKPDTDGNGKDA
ncbi:hypothetical protein [Bifidobacterium tissieri]|nr:hypothetical protein [Bifidobacterium tissieri]